MLVPLPDRESEIATEPVPVIAGASCAIPSSERLSATEPLAVFDCFAVPARLSRVEALPVPVLVCLPEPISESDSPALPLPVNDGLVTVPVPLRESATDVVPDPECFCCAVPDAERLA
jgi:hypothetical protein